MPPTETRRSFHDLRSSGSRRDRPLQLVMASRRARAGAGPCRRTRGPAADGRGDRWTTAGAVPLRSPRAGASPVAPAPSAPAPPSPFPAPFQKSSGDASAAPGFHPRDGPRDSDRRPSPSTSGLSPPPPKLRVGQPSGPDGTGAGHEQGPGKAPAPDAGRTRPLLSAPPQVPRAGEPPG